MASTVRPLKAALNGSKRYGYKSPEFSVDHLVVGGGVVGLAVARRLSQKFPDKSTFLVERHERAGEEISSRNSEVIHSGLYYPLNSLKTRFCVRGRQLLYEYCDEQGVNFSKMGKLVVANSSQMDYINGLHEKASSMGKTDTGKHFVPTRLISGIEARELEPDLSRDIAGALISPETGIIDSHGLMESFEKEMQDSDGTELVYGTKVVRVDPSPEGWIVQTVTGDGEESDALLATTLINSSGLSACLVLNSLLPEDKWLPAYFARGSYASYKGKGAGVKRLIYPCPDKTDASFASLGTHLTLDLDGRVRFGPDIDWISPPADKEHEESLSDFWKSHLVPSDEHMQEMHTAVTKYLPGVVLDGLQPDYVGIRPKLVGPGGGFQDFVIQTNYPRDFKAEGAGNISPMISLLGIESPGLTSCMAIAEYVVDGLHQT